MSKTWLGPVLGTLLDLKTWLGPVLVSSYGPAALLSQGLIAGLLHIIKKNDLACVILGIFAYTHSLFSQFCKKSCIRMAVVLKG